MKKQMIYAVSVLATVLILGNPIDVKAVGTKDMKTYGSDEQTAQILTAGVGNLFYSELTATDYKDIAEKAKGALWGYTHLGICNVEENNLNIRQEPDESGKLVGKLPKNAACEIEKSENGWAYIKSG